MPSGIKGGAKRKASPREYLLRPGEWGLIEDPKFAAWPDGHAAFAAAAYWQNIVATRATLALSKEPYFGVLTKFVSATRPPSPSALDKKLSGVSWMNLEDVLHLVLHLGRKLLPRFRDNDPRTLVYPLHLQVAESSEQSAAT